MSRDTPRISDYIGHILKAIHRINHYTEDLTEATFLGNELVQDAVIRNIEIMGEAAKNMERRYPDFTGQHPDVPWEDIYLMRNRVSHGYFSIDLEIEMGSARDAGFESGISRRLCGQRTGRNREV